MSRAIHQGTVRARLAPRREPYWGAPLEPGRFLGYRKMADQKNSKTVASETWVARARTEDAGGQRYNALGAVSDTFGYGAACKAAREWLAALDAGVVRTEEFTVLMACEEYIETGRIAPTRTEGINLRGAGRQLPHRAVRRAAAAITLGSEIRACRRLVGVKKRAA